jgi:hypothetical protein
VTSGYRIDLKSSVMFDNAFYQNFRYRSKLESWTVRVVDKLKRSAEREKVLIFFLKRSAERETVLNFFLKRSAEREKSFEFIRTFSDRKKQPQCPLLEQPHNPEKKCMSTTRATSGLC